MGFPNFYDVIVNGARGIADDLSTGSKELFEEFFGGTPVLPVDVVVGDEKVVIYADAPGRRLEDVTVEVVESTLTIVVQAQQLPEAVVGEAKVRTRDTETRTAQVTLPGPIQADGIKATLAKGVLTVAVLRGEAPKPTKVPVEKK